MGRGLLLITSAVVALGMLELAIRVFDLFAPARAAIVDARLRTVRPADAPRERQAAASVQGLVPAEKLEAPAPDPLRARWPRQSLRLRLVHR